MVLTVSFALSPAIGLCCRRHQRNAQALSPTGHQRRDVRTTRLCRPHQSRSSRDASASIASRPTFVTMANAPLSKAGWFASIAASTPRSSTISENQKWPLELPSSP